MLLLRRARPAVAPKPTAQVERSHTLVPLTDATACAWRVHARRCLHHLPSYEHPIIGCHRHQPA